MKQILKKVKHIIEIILNYLKLLLTLVFEFFLDLFNNGKSNNNELKSIKLDGTTNNDNKVDKNTVETTGHDESPSTLTINNSDSFIITNDMLEKLILERFCQELEIKEEDLTEKENEYLKTLNKKIIPILKNDLDNKIITTKDSLNEKIKKLVIEELEIQFKFEQSQELPEEKKIITPIIIRKSTEDNIIPNTKTDFNVNGTTFLKRKKNSIAVQKKPEKIVNIPTNNIIGEIPPIVPDISDKTEEIIMEENIEPLFSPSLDDDYSGVVEHVIDTPTSLEEDKIIISETLSESTSDLPILDTSLSLENTPQPESFSPTAPDNFLTIPEQPNKNPTDNKELDVYQSYDSDKLDKYIQNITWQCSQEEKKEELEDKNYEVLENQINSLLNQINSLKFKNLSPEAKKKLMIQENKLLQLKNNLNSQKQKDIELEEANLEASIINEDLEMLEKELEKLHIDDKLDLQLFMLNSLEELDNLTIEKAKVIEKELLKIKLKKAMHALEIPSLLALPFIHNKYFMFFTGGLLVNRHLKFFDAILKRKSIEYEPEELSHIKTGLTSFEEAVLMAKQNIDYLETLEMEALKKHPELMLDADFIIQINQLKTKLLQQQEKLLKKENMIKKHNLKLNKKIRKLKKKENQKI